MTGNVYTMPHRRPGATPVARGSIIKGGESASLSRVECIHRVWGFF